MSTEYDDGGERDEFGLDDPGPRAAISRPLPDALARPDPETAAALREAVRMAARARDTVGDPFAKWTIDTSTLKGLVLHIASRLEAGERPLLYPESTPEKKET